MKPLKNQKLIRRFGLRKNKSAGLIDNVILLFWPTVGFIIYTILLTMSKALAIFLNSLPLAYVFVALVWCIPVALILILILAVSTITIKPWFFDTKSNRHRELVGYVYSKYKTILVARYWNLYRSDSPGLKDRLNRLVYSEARSEGAILFKQNQLYEWYSKLSGITFIASLFYIGLSKYPKEAEGIASSILGNAEVYFTLTQHIPKELSKVVPYVMLYGSEIVYLIFNLMHREGYVYELAASRVADEFTP